jgi:hypothetical protein
MRTGSVARAPVVTVWTITASLTGVSGGECVGAAMQSEIGVPKGYTLSIAEKDRLVDVTLRSLSGDFACTFTDVPGDSTGFSTFGAGGYFSCAAGGARHGFLCANGTQRNLFALGQNISGRVSGTDISGAWNVSWDVMRSDDSSIGALETTAVFTGRR